MAKRGIVYIAQNPAFMHLFKIGKTTKSDPKDRGLSTSNVPEDFNFLRIYRCDDVDKIETLLQDQFGIYRHQSQTGRRTEFFHVNCLTHVLALIDAFNGLGIQDISNDIALELETNEEYDESASLDTVTMREVEEAPPGYDLYDNLRSRLDLPDNFNHGYFCLRVSARHKRNGVPVSVAKGRGKKYYQEDVLMEQAMIEGVLKKEFQEDVLKRISPVDPSSLFQD